MCQCSDPRWGNCADEGNGAFPSSCLAAPSEHAQMQAGEGSC